MNRSDWRGTMTHRLAFRQIGLVCAGVAGARPRPRLAHGHDPSTTGYSGLQRAALLARDALLYSPAARLVDADIYSTKVRCSSRRPLVS